MDTNNDENEEEELETVIAFARTPTTFDASTTAASFGWIRLRLGRDDVDDDFGFGRTGSGGSSPCG